MEKKIEREIDEKGGFATFSTTIAEEESDSEAYTRVSAVARSFIESLRKTRKKVLTFLHLESYEHPLQGRVRRWIIVVFFVRVPDAMKSILEKIGFSLLNLS